MSVTNQVLTESTLSLRGISKHYAGVTALADVTLEVAPGEVHAVLGENGAGKSTLMGIATGTVQPDSGTIKVAGEEVHGLDPHRAAELGIAIVHQHPAVLPDLTVLENLQVALPNSAFDGRDARTVARELLETVGLDAHLSDRVETLTLAEKHLLEIAKAFAMRPRLLVLDEPTAPLGRDAVTLLFELVRRSVAAGAAVIYITHRMAEVRQLADRVTVLRDGRLGGTGLVAETSDDELLTMIVGRQLESTFPPKVHGVGEANLVVDGLSGPGFASVAIAARPGEIVGIAGVVGNGQTELLRGLVGLEATTGTIKIGDTRLSQRDLLKRCAYVPADRHAEGLMMSLSVCENAALSALRSFRVGPLLSRGREVGGVRRSLGSLSVKAPSLDAPVGALSGGNQQKVVISRALLSDPLLLVADEPTQGVDVGARAEIYAILREASARGIPVIVASSDAKELEGLCDRVLVVSRGHVVQTLVDDEITEHRIVSAAVTSTAEVSSAAATKRDASTRTRRILQGDYAPSGLLLLVIAALAIYLVPGHDRYLSWFNISNVLLGATAVGLIALGQNIALLTGGIDLSVGPLAGFLVVLASFFVNDGKSVGQLILGLALMVGVAALVGLVNGSLIRFGGFTAIAATLTMYIALGGFAFLLRSTQGGYISLSFQNTVNSTVGPVPVAFIGIVLLALALEYGLRRRRWGWRLRAVGSDEEAARRIGVNVNRTVIAAYVTASLLTMLGALMLMGQYGIGDPSQGSAFTLTSVTAVVLGGTSLLGGRGTFIGTVVGALLLQQLLNATTFLGLGSTAQYYFQGALILAAAVLYTLLRVRRRRTLTT